MMFFVFRSEVDGQSFGFTLDATGANLPLSLAPWHRPPDDALPLDINTILVTDDMNASLSSQGWHVMRVDAPNVVRVAFGRR